MQLFNTTLNGMSNSLCNRRKFVYPTIEPMHETMQRLYQAADELRDWRGQSEVARRLNLSPQVLANWEKRGMSKGGMLTAQEKIGVSAVWLETGTGDMTGTAPLAQAELMEAWDLLLPYEREQLLEQIKARAAHNKLVQEQTTRTVSVRPKTHTPLGHSVRRGKKNVA